MAKKTKRVMKVAGVARPTKTELAAAVRVMAREVAFNVYDAECENRADSLKMDEQDGLDYDPVEGALLMVEEGDGQYGGFMPIAVDKLAEKFVIRITKTIK